MGIDKGLIGVRKKNLGEARASYIELQENALAHHIITLGVILFL